MQRALPMSQSLHTACIDYVGNYIGLSMASVSGVFVVGKSHPSRTFLLLEDSECFLNLSLLVILRSCIASLKVLNYNLEDHLKKVYDCVRFIQTIPMVKTMRGPALRTVIGPCQ